MKAEFPGETGFSSRNIKYMHDWYTFYNQNNTVLHQVGAKFGETEVSKLQGHVAENRQRAFNDLSMPNDFGLVPWRST